MSNFLELGLSEEILKVLPEIGFENPSDIQQQAIPMLVGKEQDFIGLAQTGTGKTAAFGLPMLQGLDPEWKATQALVLAPTRELAQQIAVQLNVFSKYLKGVSVEVVFGGAAISNQIRAVKKGPQVIVATPGRLIDLIQRKAVSLQNIGLVILDEADEMLNMGFKEDIDKILSFTPKEKYVWLFSATMPKEIRDIVKNYMNEPAEVRIDKEQAVNKNIEHQFTLLKRSDKALALMRFLDMHSDMKGIVFCRTRRDTQDLAELLSKEGYKAEALHGDLAQAQRDRVMKRFKEHHLQVLIATDVAARGIDVNDLTHIIHFALPDDAAYYTHRSGRTARAGKKGISLALITGGDMHKLRQLERKLSLKFEKTLVPTAEALHSKQILGWAEKVTTAQGNIEVDPEIMQQVESMFAGYDKAELLRQFLTLELEKNSKSGNRGDLNAQERESSRRNDRSRERTPSDRGGNRRERVPADRAKRPPRDGNSSDRERAPRAQSERGGSDTEWFFINIGTIDQVSKRELLNFLSDQTSLKEDSFGSIALHKTHSLFEVNKRDSKKIASRFKGLHVNDRKIRVNRDEPGGHERRK